MKRFLLGIAVASWGFAFGCAASAATYVFDISVDTRWDGEQLPPFSPFTFQQAWHVSSSPMISQGSNGPGHTYYGQAHLGSAIAGYSPLTSPIMELVDISGPRSSYFGVEKLFEYNHGVPTVGRYFFSIGDEVRTYVDLGGGKVLEKYHLRAISGHGPLPITEDGPFGESDVAGLLSQIGPLYWVEWGNASIHDTVTGTYTPIAKVNYFGTAQFVGLASSVPEPTTWALLICGFGAVGMFLRHPRPRAA
jgi:hypothetical protein